MYIADWSAKNIVAVLFFKVNLVAKITQSAYLCVIFHVKYKKLSFSRSFPIMTCKLLFPTWLLPEK